MQNQPEVSHVTIKPVPGLFTELTDRGALDRWVNGQFVRFHDGQPQKIGGWVNPLFENGPLLGIPRSSHIWNDLNGQEWIAVGTGAKLYLLSLNTLYDITPLRRQVGLSGTEIDWVDLELTAATNTPDDTFVGYSTTASLTLSENFGSVTNAATSIGTIVTLAVSDSFHELYLIIDGGVSGAPAQSAFTSITVATDGGNVVLTSASAGYSNNGTQAFWHWILGSAPWTPADVYSVSGVASSTGPFSFVGGSPVVTVNDPFHGAQNGDYVRYTGGIVPAEIASSIAVAQHTTASTPLTLLDSPTVLTGGLPFVCDISFTSTGNMSANSFVVVGTDWRGLPQTVTVGGPNDDSVVTGSLWASITSITPTETDNTHEVSVGLTMNGQFEVQNSNAQSYQITMGANASFTGTPTISVTAQYDITAGLDNPGYYYGWGAGTWGLGTWGTARTAANGAFSDMVQPLRLWALDNWGQGLMATIRNGSTYYWDRDTGPNARALDISVNPQYPNNPGAPVNSLWSLVSNVEQQLVTLGSSHDGINDALYIAISDIDDYTDFTPTDENSAYTGRLSSGSKIVTGIKTRTGLLVMTDTSPYLLAPNAASVFSSEQIADETTILSPHAAIDVNGTAYIMGLRKFYEYDGVFRELTTDVWSRVWRNFNYTLPDKVFAWHNDQWSEVWWFYCSQNATEVDSYVIYNYKDKHWSFGNLDRTCGLKTSTYYNYPLMFDSVAGLYEHEDGMDSANYQNVISAITSYVQTYDIQTVQRSPYGAVTPGRGLAYNEGAEEIHISQVVPDIIYQTGNMTLTIQTKRYPQGAYVTKGPYTITPASGNPTLANQIVSVRARGKLANFTYGSSTLGSDWRIGNFTFLTQDDGER